MGAVDVNWSLQEDRLNSVRCQIGEAQFDHQRGDDRFVSGVRAFNCEVEFRHINPPESAPTVS